MRRFFVFLIVMISLTAALSVVPLLKSRAISNVNDLEDIGFEEKLGLPIDSGVQLLRTDGRQVSMSSFFGQKKPVVLNLAYFTCPTICLLGTDGVLEAVNRLDSFRPGKDYTILTVSFDPEESVSAIGAKADQYANALAGGAEEAGGWRFFTATRENILKLTDSVGFRFREDGDEFAHPSGIVVLTPEGKISRYLYGIEHDPRNFKLSLIEASAGKIGSSELLNKVIMFCYQFDPIGKRYALAALNVVKAGGMITLTVLAAFLYFMWKKEKKLF